MSCGSGREGTGPCEVPWGVPHGPLPDPRGGRFARLDQLARGLAREVGLWRGGNDPLLFAERRMYLKAIQDALAGAEGARGWCWSGW